MASQGSCFDQRFTSGIGICLLAAGNAPIFDGGEVTMVPVHDLSHSELVLAWNERHFPALLETFAAMYQRVAMRSVGAASLRSRPCASRAMT